MLSIDDNRAIAAMHFVARCSLWYAGTVGPRCQYDKELADRLKAAWELIAGVEQS